eukprot:605326-Pyramimonas_sp.AAC.1
MPRIAHVAARCRTVLTSMAHNIKQMYTTYLSPHSLHRITFTSAVNNALLRVQAGQQFSILLPLGLAPNASETAHEASKGAPGRPLHPQDDFFLLGPERSGSDSRPRGSDFGFVGSAFGLIIHGGSNFYPI